MKFPNWIAHPTPKRRKRFLWAGTAFLAYLLIGFFVLPPILKSQITKRAAAATHRQATVRQVKVNPLTLSLTVRGLALTETNGAPFVAFDEFYANFQLSSLFRWAWTFDEIHLHRPRGEIVLNEDGSFNFSDLVSQTNAAAAPANGKPAGVPRLLVFSLLITNGQVNFADFTRRTPFKSSYAPINLHLKRFTTKPDRESPYSFEASSDEKRTLQWAGSVTAQPPGSSGTLRISGFQFPKHSPYLEDITRALLTSGTLDVAAAYHFILATNGMDLTVSNLAVTVSNLQFKNPDTGESVLSVPRYELRDGTLDWRTRDVRIGSIVITEPASLVRRRSDGTINLASLILPQVAPTSASPEPVAAAPIPDVPTKPWTLTLADCRLDGGTLELEDATVDGPFRTTLKPIDLRIQHFTTRPNVDATIEAVVTTEAGESVKLNAACSIEPLRATGTLELTALALKKYQGYLKPFFRGELAGNTDAVVKFAHSRNEDVHHVTVSNSTLRVAQLQVTAPDTGEVVLIVPEFSIENVSGVLADKAVRAGSIASDGARVLARREPDGSVNLLNLLGSTTNQAAATPGRADTVTAEPMVIEEPAEGDSGWQVLLDEVALTNYSFRIEDRLMAKPGVLVIDQFALNLNGVRFPSNAPVEMNLSARINERGTIATHGTVRPYSPAADLELEMNDLVLGGFQSWIESGVRLAIHSGSLSTRGHLHLSAPGEAGPKVGFEGGLSITDLVTADQVWSKEFVRWDELAVTGAAIELEPHRAEIEQVRFAGLKASVVIGPDKRPNFLVILAGPDQTNAPAANTDPGTPASSTAGLAEAREGAQFLTPDSSTPAEPFAVQVNELRFDNASIHFGDESIQPPCSFDVQQFSGTIKGLSSRPGTVAELEVDGKVDGNAPFGLRGTVNPLSKDLALDLVFTNQNLQLAPFTPYFEKYAGHPLLRGRLSLVLDYAVHERQLDAKNSVHLDQFTLGPRNESPDATGLPVRLAVALLKDREGQIDLDLPLDGRIDDPGFRIAPLVWKVLGNVIVKAATSPFKLLGALVGGGEELSFIEFEPGESQWRDGEPGKLTKLVKALQERPALSLEIQGSVDPVLDRDAIALRMIREDMKAARLQELSDAGQAPEATEDFVPEPDQLERLLRARIAREFGTNLTEALAELASRQANNQVASQPRRSEKKGLLRRAVALALVPFQRGNHPAAIARRQAKADAALLKQNPVLATVTAESLELLLASRIEVPPDRFLKLMQDRAKAVQAELLKDGELSADRLFLVAPGPVDVAKPGSATVNLSLY